MKKILFQSDDYGMTPGIIDGTIRAIKEGVVRNTGIFINSPYASEALEKIKGLDVCLGIDINLVNGKPISDATLIPHLLNKKGEFFTSREILNNNEFESLEGITTIFKEDPYPYNEVLIEVENQVKKFIDMTGKLPGYMSPHSLMTPNIEKATKIVAEKYGIYRLVDLMNDDKYIPLPGFLQLSKSITMEEQINANVVDYLLTTALPTLNDGETGYYVFHCGYVDYELCQSSSLNLRRMRDLEASCSNLIKQYLKDNAFELISYYDLLK